MEELSEAHIKVETNLKKYQVGLSQQVKENESTVRRYRKMIEDEKQFAITKFAKDLLEVREAIRLALENTDLDKIKAENDLAKIKD